MKHTKRLFFPLLLGLSLLLCACSGSDEVTPPQGMILACDPEATDYYFFVPKEWTVDMTDTTSAAYYSTNDPSSVSVMVWELEHADSTLDDWWAANEADLPLIFQNYALVSSENLTVDGCYAKRYVYTGDLGQNHYQIMQTGVLKDARVYLLTYTSLADNYASHEEDVNKMLENFLFQ